eukprot:TRINITY_DN10538_c0_g1_i4.p1 TRINITY_DN10538_c0_g1~~TRINITY_DN10538_c0_g1_i4.p1  ORF type:complete len:449 (+),score=87.81 TRINITY_DN10538_c0_g1_i4:114-1460(+)
MQRAATILRQLVPLAHVARSLHRRSSSHPSRVALAIRQYASHLTAIVEERYRKQVEAGELELNPKQIELCQALDGLYDDLLNQTPPSNSWFSRILGSRHELIRGLYIWGTVGSGKTMLMDDFFAAIPVQRKRRIHFHSFMLDVHARIHEKKMMNIADPIPPVAADLLRESYLLCFDEFQVTDVADAMILRRLFEELFHGGLVMIATSNRPPEDLYKGGLQRSQFKPFIPLLQKHTKEVCLSSDKDYRLQGLLTKMQQQCFFTPLSDDQTLEMQRLWQEVCEEEGKPMQPTELQLKGRTLHVPNACGNVAWFDFDDLCRTAVAAADYLKIAQEFHTVFVANTPQMKMQDRDAARRFITLIDCLYDNAVRLVWSAETDPEHLFQAKGNDLTDSKRMLMDDLNLDMSALDNASIFTGEDEIFAWQRLVSRLGEMQSKEYWEMCQKFWVGKA